VAGSAAGFDARWIDLALVALLALALRLPSASLSVFASADESAFILDAREVLLGHLPYLTFWDHKPLGSTLMIAAAMALFGQSVEVVRALGLACVVGTAWALYLIARRVWPDRLVALGAAALYVAYSTRISGIATITEILLAPFTAAGVLLLLVAAVRQRDGRDAALAWAAAGLSFGIAVWIKYVPAIPAALTGGLLLLAALLRRERGGLACAIGHGALFSVGLLPPTAASIGVY
jgi:4-amino-4-deoxy-L-arabinose transferase-like glycosyltransferase